MTARVLFSLLIITVSLPITVEAQTFDLKRGWLVRVQTQDGSTLAGHVASTSDDSFALRTDGELPTRVEWSRVDGIERYAQNPTNELIGMGAGLIVGSFVAGQFISLLFAGRPSLDLEHLPELMLFGSPIGIVVGMPIGGAIGARKGMRWVDVPPGTTARGVGLKIRF